MKTQEIVQYAHALYEAHGDKAEAEAAQKATDEKAAGNADEAEKWQKIRMHIKEESEEAYYLSNARAFKKVIDVPLMLVGGMRSPGLMEKLLEDGEAEMISLCRPLIREPDLANRWKRGDRRKADCISCGGCQKYLNDPVRCILLDK